MHSDKNEFFEFLTTLERISNKINDEISILKKKLKISDYEPKLRKCSYNLLENILMPLFDEKETVTLDEIIKKSGKKKTTVLCYLSELYKYRRISKAKNIDGDKRTKIYKKELF